MALLSIPMQMTTSFTFKATNVFKFLNADKTGAMMIGPKQPNTILPHHQNFLDYCNAEFSGCSNTPIQKAAARTCTKTKKYEHISPILASLHWLPVQS